MAALTPIFRKPMKLVVPTVAAAGGLLGLFVGTANGSGFLGVLIGASPAWRTHRVDIVACLARLD